MQQQIKFCSHSHLSLLMKASFWPYIHRREIGNCVSSSIVRFNRAIDNIKMSLKCEHELLRKLIEQSYRDADIYSFNRMCLDWAAESQRRRSKKKKMSAMYVKEIIENQYTLYSLLLVHRHLVLDVVAAIDIVHGTELHIKYNPLTTSQILSFPLTLQRQ